MIAARIWSIATHMTTRPRSIGLSEKLVRQLKNLAVQRLILVQQVLNILWIVTTIVQARRQFGASAIEVSP